jgi:hypothetical protein
MSSPPEGSIATIDGVLNRAVAVDCGSRFEMRWFAVGDRTTVWPVTA